MSNGKVGGRVYFKMSNSKYILLFYSKFGIKDSKISEVMKESIMGDEIGNPGGLEISKSNFWEEGWGAPDLEHPDLEWIKEIGYKYSVVSRLEKESKNFGKFKKYF